MPAQKPLRGVSKVGRSDAANKSDFQLLLGFVHHVPDVTAGVARMLGDRPTDLNVAFGDPIAFLREAMPGLSEKEFAERAHHIKAALAADPREIDAKELREEAAHAKIEIVRYWAAKIVMAWELWGKAEGKLRLSRELAPLMNEQISSRARDEWSEYLEDSKQVLLTTVALDADGLELAAAGLSEQLRSRCAQEKSIPFVAGLRIHPRGTGYVVEPA